MMLDLSQNVGAASPATRDWLARARIMLTYAARQYRLPDLANPRRFTELVQQRKLEDRDPLQTVLMDKLAAKAMAARRLGPEWTIPTIWTGSSLPQHQPFACPAIVKARHGCNQYCVLRHAPDAQSWQALRNLAAKWTAKPYGGWLDEWAYKGVTRGVIAEPLIDGGGGALPVDYKFYVFGGKATHVQVHLDRGGAHRWVLHDRNYRQLVPVADAPPAPRSLAAMLDAAEELATGFDFLRVDFYEVAGKPLFGEFCLYPGSGLDQFAADWIDFELGELWLDAIGRDQPSALAGAVSCTNTSSRSASRVVTSSTV